MLDNILYACQIKLHEMTLKVLNQFWRQPLDLNKNVT